MKSGDRTRLPGVSVFVRNPAPLFRWLTIAACLVAITGCSSLRRSPPPPGRTTFAAPLVLLPAQSIGNFLVIEAKWDRFGPYHFLIDTGSSVTHVTPALARRYPGRTPILVNAPRVRVAAEDGTTTELPSAWLRQIQLGAARFDEVPVVLNDFICAQLSAHLGIRIDGVLGFPFFRETLLTLDYPGSRVVLQPAKTMAIPPGAVIPFDGARKTPVIPMRLGDRFVVTLIDSGSDATFSLNPASLELRYEQPPRPGATIGTIAGDRIQQIGRLAERVAIGQYQFDHPIVDLSDELSAIGGAVLKNFVVTFDQERDRVMFHRDVREPITMSARRSAGVSFSKAPPYWRVVGIVPQSPAATAGIQSGDLVIRINGDPVNKWDLPRYEQLVATANEITFTFLHGTTETEKRLKVFELVP